MKPYRIERAALAEIAGESAYYDGEKPGIGEELARRVEECLALLAAQPQLGEVVPLLRTRLDLRRILLRQFPFWIVYVNSAESIDVLALAHTSRDPLYWRDRVR